jgi:uncharacterized membrane protein (DUF4010 family)
MPHPEQLSAAAIAVRLAIAGLVGLAVGTEREWSGPTSGPQRRFAGLRTFLLFGMLGGIAGILIASGLTAPATALLAGCTAFIVAAYVMAVRRPEQPLHGTTEAAAFVVLGLGVLAGIGYLALAAGTVTIVVFALAEKQQLHWLVSRIGRLELLAALQFLVLALVILPLLPTGPYDTLWGFRPRALWAIAVMLSGLNFAGYIAQRTLGPTRGYLLTGLLGGIASSTIVTVQSSRLSRTEPEYGAALGLGVITACTVLPLRVMVLSLVLRADLARALLPYLLPSFIVGFLLIVLSLRHPAPRAGAPEEGRSPLRLGSALQMAFVFQIAIIGISFARSALGSSGLLGSAAILGLVDADALTVAMSRLTAGVDVVRLAAHGIAVGILASTVFKLLIALIVGCRTFRRRAVAGLAAMAIALVVASWWSWQR